MKAALLCGTVICVCAVSPVQAQSTATALTASGSTGAGPAQSTAPSTDGTNNDDIVVTGIRASQRASLELKRAAPRDRRRCYRH